MTICPVCEENNRDKNMFCINCGEELIPSTAKRQSLISTPSASPLRFSPSPVIKALPVVSVSSHPPNEHAAPFPDIPLDSSLPPSMPLQDMAPVPDRSEYHIYADPVPVQDFDPPRVVAPTPGEPEDIIIPDHMPEPVQDFAGLCIAAPFPDIPDKDESPAPVLSQVDHSPMVAAPFPDDLEESQGSDPVSDPNVPESLDVATFPPDPFEAQETGTSEPISDNALSQQDQALPNLDHIAGFPNEMSYSSTPGSLSSGTQLVKTTIPAPVQWQNKECVMCGFQNVAEAVYCVQCGTAINISESNSAVDSRAFKLVQLAVDGGETAEFEIDTRGLAIDGETGDLSNVDEYRIDTHAMFILKETDTILIPPGGGYGIFSRIPPKKPVKIQTGSIIRIGHQFLIFEAGTTKSHAWGMLKTTPPTSEPKTIALDKEEIIIGRESGHIQFSDDPLVSGIHMKLYTANGRFFLCDMASTNGTFLQIASQYRPIPGQVFMIGAKFYKFTNG